MSLLSINKRKAFMKYLGYEYNSKGIREFQKKYFKAKDVDGKYGKNTDILLRHCYNIKKYAPHFSPTEFKCECNGRHCNGYPTWMKKNQLELLETLRRHYKKPIKVTCGLRCNGYNAELNGSIARSLHMNGKATDFYMKGVTDTLTNRKKAVRYIKTVDKTGYCYGDGINIYGDVIHASYMGNALHVDVGV